MKRGPKSAADTAFTLRRVAEANARASFQPRHPMDGMLIQHACAWCPSRTAVAEWIPGLNRLDLCCLACGRSITA